MKTVRVASRPRMVKRISSQFDNDLIANSVTKSDAKSVDFHNQAMRIGAEFESPF